jgi:hypothetical protein
MATFYYYAAKRGIIVPTSLAHLQLLRHGAAQLKVGDCVYDIELCELDVLSSEELLTLVNLLKTLPFKEDE